ncbi:hypothetical protein [Agrobacterium tumefaciens]|uniref:hypothetical protein n=1 Tax=Agrobacterium tumefaciens TaxID=358 RepID=UPI0015731BC2|nr:hypothetical protein [Agrobacterium tumefaciens]
MTIRKDMFGPHIRAEVSIINGKADKVELFHPDKARSVIFPAEWACDVVGTDKEILDAVKASLNGATVVKV